MLGTCLDECVWVHGITIRVDFVLIIIWFRFLHIYMCICVFVFHDNIFLTGIASFISFASFYGCVVL